MSSTEVQDTSLLDAAEFDSESCSSDDRGTHKRLCTDFESAVPKKRRKQTTPLRFPTCLKISNHHETEDEEEEEEEEGEIKNVDSEGKTLKSPQAKSLHTQSAQDEIRVADNQCHLCNQKFDDKSTLNQHIECEHFVTTESSQHLQSKPLNSIKTELDVSSFQEQSTSPVNLSSISIKNFATWIPTQSTISNQPQKDDWSSNPHKLTLSEHIPGMAPFPNALTQYLHYPGFPLADSSQIQPRPSIGPVPPRIFNRDAYCELCNKEFCNKYFLKTHKANKHGIYTESSNSHSTGEIVAGTPVSSSTNNFKTEPQPHNSDSSATSPFAISPKPSFFCDICQKGFQSEDILKKHKEQVHEFSESSEIINQSDEKSEIISSQSPSVMEMLFRQEYSMEQEEKSIASSSKEQFQQAVQLVTESGLSIEHLRKLGIINVDVFCDICCKEFSNKIFLRAHKLKQHGILSHNNDKSSTTSGTWHHIQTSPLNLIVNESANIPEFDEHDEEHICRTCGIRFQTAELYETHQQKIHDEKLTSPNKDPELSNHKLDTISDDLQKLQTMILQLNGLESHKKETTCSVCGAEFENKALLQMHISSEHDFTSENSSTPQEVEKSPSSHSFCTICEKDFLNEESLRKHINEDHSPSTPTSVNFSQVPAAPMATSTPKPPTQSERKPPSSMTPTSSYCEICNKELCNKYFMKTHMHRMHGIEISNGAQIGGVICNICNKELCSKYFLRVHKHNTHGIVDESNPVPIKQESFIKQDSFETSNSEDNSLKPEHPNDLSNRYFSHFTEVCPVCSRRFRKVQWLKAHLLGDHGKIGAEKWKEFEELYPVTRLGNRLPTTPRPSQSSPGLKIPNGQEIIPQQNKIGDFTTLGTQVLSNLFGSSTDDQRSKGYRCSLCNFTTTALPFLFLHERTHTNPQAVDGSSSLQCHICSQVFPKLEMLHHHLLSNHQLPGMLSQFPTAVLNNFTNKESKENTTLNLKIEKKHDHQAGLGNEGESYAIQKTDSATIEVTTHGAYKCAQCGFATANLNRIKKHVKKDHKSIGDITDCVIAELSRTLKEVANKHKLPASYAMPQDMNSNPDKTIMQPFLIEEYDVSVQGGDDCNSIKRFAPALVYLPVKARVNTVLTASFTLSPA